MTATKVFLREKKISKGRKSLYLDFYPPIKNPNTGKETRREFLGLYIYEKTKTPFETQHNKETKNIAEGIRNQRYFEIQNDTYGFNSEAKKRKSFMDFFENFTKQKYTSESNYKNWLSACKYFSDFCKGSLSMGELSIETIEEYREYLLATDLAQNTKHTYYNKFRATIKEAFKKGFIPENYAARVDTIKAEETRREFVTLEELRLLVETECENPILKKAFIFSALTGLRHSDILALKWQDVQGNEENGYFIRFQQQKTKGQETLPIPKPAFELLGEKKHPNDRIFKGLKYSAWQNLKLREWVMDAGIKKKITFHCARHSFATIQLDLGTDIYTVSKLLGHKEIKTTQIYAKVMDKNKQKAMNKLNDFEL